MPLSLYQYFKDRSAELTETWYANLDKSKEGIYGSTDPIKIKQLKAQNRQFHELFIEIFNPANEEVDIYINKWVTDIASDRAHLETPLPEIMEEFLNTQSLYLHILHQYIETHHPEMSIKKYNETIQLILRSFKKIMIAFSVRNQELSEELLQAQKDMITELSSPVIHLNEQIALLPLIGEIDTHRAKVIFDQTLEQCVNTRVDSLLIDLSGVPVIDTMVANQIFSLIDGLKLIGTKASLSGIRPEIAQTAIQLGIDFTHIRIYSSISAALEKLSFEAKLS
ncbi:STAS domain-containing protein [Shouchella clausii]|uniref:STAS domain-containing protein n=1 Tax=Shouchella clausii TaxID=79880 RepID=UPI000BA5344E|nr:STAS domain-containing protein [Shouchella clausii]PAD94148.1 anti-anti-sigma factor [Shouchella clausii]PTL23845.1 STAS domain-containing protein [Shouchella clausii]